MPSTPSQKSMEVWRLAPVRVMWCTPWLWSFCMGHSPRELMLDQFGLVFTTLQAAVRHKFDTGREDQHTTQPVTDGFGQTCTFRHVLGKFNLDGKRWLLLYAGLVRLYQNMAADL